MEPSSGNLYIGNFAFKRELHSTTGKRTDGRSMVRDISGFIKFEMATKRYERFENLW